MCPRAAAGETTEPEALPAWLAAPSSYEPARDRDGFLRKNILSLTSALLVLRAEPAASTAQSAVDRALLRVSPALRLVGSLALILCVSLARNMAFVWVALVGWLVLLALRSPERVRAIFVPALVVAALALLINLPALLLGQPTAPVRLASKSLVTTGVAVGLAVTLGPEGLVGALRALRVPRRALMVVEFALRDVVVLGESAVSLSEALALRSVGRDRTKTASAAGVMGAVFVRAHARATARAEAMELRGYDGRGAGAAARAGSPVANAAYGLVLAGALGLFGYLELVLA